MLISVENGNCFITFVPDYVLKYSLVLILYFGMELEKGHIKMALKFTWF